MYPYNNLLNLHPFYLCIAKFSKWDSPLWLSFLQLAAKLLLLIYWEWLGLWISHVKENFVKLQIKNECITLCYLIGLSRWPSTGNQRALTPKDMYSGAVGEERSVWPHQHRPGDVWKVLLWLGALELLHSGWGSRPRHPLAQAGDFQWQGPVQVRVGASLIIATLLKPRWESLLPLVP